MQIHLLLIAFITVMFPSEQREVTHCPTSIISWNERKSETKCETAGESYHCILLYKSSQLYEVCMQTKVIPPGKGGCPWMSFYKGEALLGAAHSPCPADLTGCPPDNHRGYYSDQLYLYPICFVPENSRESESSSPVPFTVYPITITTHLTPSTEERSTAIVQNLDISSRDVLIPVVVAVFIALLLLGVAGAFCLFRKCRETRSQGLDGDAASCELGESQPLTSENIDRHEKLKVLQKVVYDKNRFESGNVPLFPLQKGSRVLPVDLLYVPVSICHELEARQDRFKPGDNGGLLQQKKAVESPHEIFYKNDNPVQYVFMRGEAAHGKSIYCLRLTRRWCAAKEEGSCQGKISNWNAILGQYEFLFRIELRHVRGNSASLIDMICSDVYTNNPDLHDTIRHVLRSEAHKCLIIVDGLDEWKYSEDVRRQLMYAGMPNTDYMSNCTFFFTARPWKLDEIPIVVRLNPQTRVIQIQGLLERDVTSVIEMVLLRFYNMQPESKDFKNHCHNLKQKFENVKLKSIMQIPLLATAAVQLWVEEESVGENLTTFYFDLLRLLIKRTFDTKESYQKIKAEFRKEVDDSQLPQPIQRHTSAKDFLPALCSLGKLAYDDLTSKTTKLVFPEEELLDKLGEKTLDFSQKVGLISHQEEGGHFGSPYLRAMFFHKSVQEFLAAFYLVCGKSITLEAFLRHLTSVSHIMELSNVVLFILGFVPSHCRKITEHIVSIANVDKDLCRYRETFEYEHWRKVFQLNDLMVSCYKEIVYTCNMYPSEQIHDQDFQIQDVIVRKYYTSNETKEMIKVLLSRHQQSIKSLCIEDAVGLRESITHFLNTTTSLEYLYLWDTIIKQFSPRLRHLKSLDLYRVVITPGVAFAIQKTLEDNNNLRSLKLRYIATRTGDKKYNAQLRDIINVLPGCPNLSSLHIRGLGGEEDATSLTSVLHQLKSLRKFEYGGGNDKTAMFHMQVTNAACRIQYLQSLQLVYLNLGCGSIELSPDMLSMDSIFLWQVQMSPEGWQTFVNSLTQKDPKC